MVNDRLTQELNNKRSMSSDEFARVVHDVVGSALEVDLYCGRRKWMGNVKDLPSDSVSLTLLPRGEDPAMVKSAVAQLSLRVRSKAAFLLQPGTVKTLRGSK